LRKISISAKDLLLEIKKVDSLDGTQTEYALNTDMVEFIRSIRNKYRIYLITRLEQDDSKVQDGIHDVFMKLVKQDIIKGKQRLMYNSSEVGHIA
jgi:hypothetical protein